MADGRGRSGGRQPGTGVDHQDLRVRPGLLTGPQPLDQGAQAGRGHNLHPGHQACLGCILDGHDGPLETGGSRRSGAGQNAGNRPQPTVQA